MFLTYTFLTPVLESAILQEALVVLVESNITRVQFGPRDAHCFWVVIVVYPVSRCSKIYMYIYIYIYNCVCFLKMILLIHLFLAVPGLHCCMGFSLVVVRGILSSCSAQSSYCSGFSCETRALGYMCFGSCGM